MTVNVALATDNGYVTGLAVLTDGRDPDEQSFDDWFSDGPDRVANKAAITFRIDIWVSKRRSTRTWN